MIQTLLPRLRAFAQQPYVRMVALAVLYLAILAALLVLYGRGNFSTPGFIYQGF